MSIFNTPVPASDGHKDNKGSTGGKSDPCEGLAKGSGGFPTKQTEDVKVGKSPIRPLGK